MIKNDLLLKGKLEAKTTQPLIIYHKDLISHSECYDTAKNKWLDVNDIDESYELDIIENNDNDSVDVMIPKDRRVILRKPSNYDSDCLIEYKNIEVELMFEDEPMDLFLEEIE